MILLASSPMPFSDRGRAWKILGALLLLYAGCRYNHQRSKTLDPPIWACAAHPDRFEGHRFWILAEGIAALDPAGAWFEAEPTGYRVRVQIPPGTAPEGLKEGRDVYASVLFQGGAFVLEPGSRTAAPEPLTHLSLYLISIPALGFVAVCFLKRFRPSLSWTLECRRDA